MASALIKKALLSNPIAVRKTTGLFCVALRNHWNYQYKPGPYPKTPEERAAAAQKYGMSIEEYEPYPEEQCYGDYPKLPNIGDDSKDNFYQYDLPATKRNFNEPMHAWAEILGEDRYDISRKTRFPVWVMAAKFFGLMATMFTIYFILEDYKMGRPVTAKQYPGEGPHFMFNN